MTQTARKSILLLEEGELILVNGLTCKVLAIDVTPSGKTAKVFYEINGVAESMRCGTSTFLQVVEEVEEEEANIIHKNVEIPILTGNVVNMFDRKSKLQSALETLSNDYQEYYKIIQNEYKEVHDFYLKHILVMPAMARKSLELTMEEMKSARDHILEKHQTDIGTPMPKGF